jgi:hypothetical protein
MLMRSIRNSFSGSYEVAPVENFRVEFGALVSYFSIANVPGLGDRR